jgi:nitrilase
MTVAAVQSAGVSRAQAPTGTTAAAIQMVSGVEVPANLATAARLLAEAAARGARLAVLPENFALMARSDAERAVAAEDDGRGPIQEFLAAQAARHGLWLVGGTIQIRAHGAARLRSACLVYDDRGHRVARYDKMHLFDVRLEGGEEYRESAILEPGEQPVAVDTPFGCLGIAICYDLRFPELFRRLLDAGAQVFAVPSAFTATTGRAHWEVLVRARAIENLAYVIAPDQGGQHANGRATHGDTMIVSPWGEVLGRLASGEGVVTAELDADRLARARASLPSIEHRRIGVVSAES